jgi:hypothetical protein
VPGNALFSKLHFTNKGHLKAVKLLYQPFLALPLAYFGPQGSGLACFARLLFDPLSF